MRSCCQGGKLRGMNERTTTRPARLAPLGASKWSAALRVLLSVSPGGTRQPMNVFTTLARHESLLWAWLPFAGKLLAGKLDARHRELAILRTAYRCGCAYERGHHRAIGREIGLQEHELHAIEDDLEAADWEAGDRLVLEVADELHTENRVSDATWTRMRDRFSDAQIIELVMLVGHYHMVAFTLNTLQVELEPEMPSASGFVRAIQRVVLKGKK